MLFDMPEPIIIALIASIPPTLAATAALVVSFRNTSKIQNIHLAMNSRFDEWMRLAKESSFAAGVKSEQDKTPDRK